MAQHDYVIANGTGAAVRSDLNNALAAIVSNNSGATEPATMYAYQWWADTSTGLLKLRNAANNAWITLRELDGTLTIEDGTASSPGLAFADDLNTGIYSPSADQLGITTGGTVRLTTTTTGITSALPVDVPLGTASAPTVTFTGDLNTGIYSPGADQVAITTNGVERVEWGTSEVVFNDGGANYDFRIEGDTNSSLFFVDASAEAVGIGSTSPLNKLVVASSGVGYEIDQSSIGNTNLLLSYDRGASAYRAVANYYGGTYSWNDSGSERARIDSSGRLLVGTSTAPTQGSFNQFGKLIVQGNTFSAAGNGLVSINRGEGATSITAGEELGVIAFGDNDGNTFGIIQCVADAAAGAGDFPGRLVFSTTADGASFPTERMRITNTGRTELVSASDGYIVGTTAAAGTSTELFRGAHSSTAGSQNTGTISIRIYNNGNIQNANNSYGSLSDIKLKENIVDATSQWDDLKALQVRKYNFKEGQTHTQIGLVAQEVELVSPGLVSESPDRDEDGNDLGTVTKSVNYSVLYMKAVKALQEAMERIETLEAAVTALQQS